MVRARARARLLAELEARSHLLERLQQPFRVGGDHSVLGGEHCLARGLVRVRGRVRVRVRGRVGVRGRGRVGVRAA